MFEIDQLTEFMNLAPEVLASVRPWHCAVRLDVGKLHQSSTEYRLQYLHIAISKLGNTWKRLRPSFFFSEAQKNELQDLLVS